jgi:zinc transporter, ZIP family
MTEVQAFLLTLFAGLSTGIGGLFAFHKKASGRTFLTASLGFSAGVMIYVSFVEILPKAIRSLEETQFAENGYLVGTLAFFAGILVIALIDFLVPKQENPHEFPDETETDGDIRSSLFRMGIFSALAIGIHNFPEGLATFIAALESPTLGISIGIAIAIHNIPEGIAVAIPIYQATGSRKKAFLYALLSGLSEPVGALIGGFLLIWLLNDLAFGLTFAFVAGIMVYISVDELLPTAERYGKHHISIIGLVGGMAVMAMSLILFS